MAYSRFSNSLFYTFRSTNCGKEKEEQVFACHTQTESFSVSYRDLVGGVDAFVDKVCVSLEAPCRTCASELKQYIETFIHEIDVEYRNVG